MAGGHIRSENYDGDEVAKAELAVPAALIGGEVVQGETAVRFHVRDDESVEVRVVRYVDGVATELGSIHVD